MRRLATLLAALVTAAAVLITSPGSALAQPAPKTSLPDVEDEVMCVECGTALNLSQAAVADQMRGFIKSEIAKGRSKDEIKASLASQFGDVVLADPPRRGFNLAVYIVPPLVALLALGGIAVAARRWRRAGPQPEPVAAPALADADAQRLDRDMAAYDL